MPEARGTVEADPVLVALGARIVRLRKAAGLTQEAAAHEGGVALRTLQNLEAGRLNPGYLTLRAVAGGLGVTPAKLLTGL
jgi:transcriptional regulator with XRE-family HTH domain